MEILHLDVLQVIVDTRHNIFHNIRADIIFILLNGQLRD